MTRAALVCAFVVAAAGQAWAQASAPIVVVPFANVGNEPRVHWLGEASAVLVADELRALGVSAIQRTDRVSAFEMLHLPPAAELSRATVIKVGQIVGAMNQKLAVRDVIYTLVEEYVDAVERLQKLQA